MEQHVEKLLNTENICDNAMTCGKVEGPCVN